MARSQVRHLIPFLITPSYVHALVVENRLGVWDREYLDEAVGERSCEYRIVVFGARHDADVSRQEVAVVVERCQYFEWLLILALL